MPHFAEQEGDLVRPWEVDHSNPAYCPFCGAMMGVRDAHYNQGKRIKQHFFHKRGGGCGGESDIHRRMKVIARYHLEQLFGHARVESEVQIGDRFADVVAILPWPLKPFGRGFVVEVQHKHKGKNIGRVSQEYLEAGYSVFWAYQSDFDEDEKTMRIVPKRARTVWPDAVPDREGIEGYPTPIQRLWNGEFSSEGFPPIRIPEEYWRIHALEVASPRHGRYQTDWDLIAEVQLLHTEAGRSRLTLNRSPDGDYWIELWLDPHSDDERASFLPARVSAGDARPFRQFIDRAADVLDSDYSCTEGQLDVLTGAELTATPYTRSWIGLVDDEPGHLSLTLARIDYKGNERTVHKQMHEGDLDRLEEMAHRLEQYLCRA